MTQNHFSKISNNILVWYFMACKRAWVLTHGEKIFLVKRILYKNSFSLICMRFGGGEVLEHRKMNLISSFFSFQRISQLREYFLEKKNKLWNYSCGNWIEQPSSFPVSIFLSKMIINARSAGFWLHKRKFCRIKI